MKETHRLRCSLFEAAAVSCSSKNRLFCGMNHHLCFVDQSQLPFIKPLAFLKRIIIFKKNYETCAVQVSLPWSRPPLLAGANTFRWPILAVLSEQASVAGRGKLSGERGTRAD